jgi:hypothetical protein
MVTVKRKTTEKGLGWRHRQDRQGLLRKHPDGAKCEWCGRPMYLDRTRNWDYDPRSTNPASGSLHADHSDMSRAEALRLGVPMPRANRLLHGACNIQRGEGGNDHLAAVANGNTTIHTNQLAMAWPW